MLMRNRVIYNMSLLIFNSKFISLLKPKKYYLGFLK